MSLTLLTTPVDNTTILTAAIWISEFNNIYQNALSLISPLTGNLDFSTSRAIGLSLGTVSSPAVQFTGDTNTGFYSSAADTADIATGGVQAASFGASFVLRAAPEDSRTATVDVAGIIESTTSGAPAAGIGVGLQFNAESGDENPSVFGRLDFAAADIGAGTEDTYFDVLTRVAGAAAVTTYRMQATGAFKAIFTHANSADRTYTLQNSSDTLVGRATTDTLTNKTLTSPIITGVAGIPTIVLKTADETVNASDTFQDDNHLLAPVAASKLYGVELHLILNSANSAANFKFQWTGPAGYSMVWGSSAAHNVGAGPTAAYWGGVAAAENNSTLLTEASTLTQGDAVGTTGVIIWAIVSIAGTAGTLQLQWAQNTSTASDSKVLLGSYMSITLLN